VSRLRPLVLAALAAAAACGTAACKEQPPQVPGETTIRVASVTIEAMDPGAPLSVPHGALFDRLGMRPGSLINTDRTWSPFREAEDRRRIETFWQWHGYFDVEVAPAVVTDDPDGKKSVVYRVRENRRYAIGDLRLEHAPPEEEPTLRAMIPFAPGTTAIDVEAFRRVRIDMQEHLRRRGWGHANVYSRTWVDRSSKTLAWYYLVDAGPRTRIGRVIVDGARAVDESAILDRAGLRTGDPYTEDLRDRVVRDLLDTGSFVAAYVRVDTDTKFIVPGTVPDSGGELRDEQVDAEGNLVPRRLPEDVNITIHVTEGRRRTLRLGATFEIDPARADTSLGAKTWFRDVFGSMDHLVLEGRVGYGQWLDGRDRDDGQNGVYGEALARTIHGGALGRTGDLRLSARLRHEPFPDAALRELSAGPGARFNLGKGLFLDLDLLAVHAESLGYGPFTAAERAGFALPGDDVAYGPELQASVTWDARDDAVEAMRGHLLRLALRGSPGEPLATHRWVSAEPDARLLVPLARPLSLGLRAAAGFVGGEDDEGLPLGARLFGGGAWGFRGLGRKQLSPEVVRCVDGGVGPLCSEEEVGGASLLEATAELRLLPPQSPVGAVAFVDLGGASQTLNPLRDGPSLAAGLGGRVRLWYLPLALDAGWRLVDAGQAVAIDEDPLAIFFRLGEAF
jgi:hypothetical protein